MFAFINDKLMLNLTPHWRGLSFKEVTKEKRPPFSTKWIVEKILAPGAFDGLNDAARCIALAMVNTGARPSEIANLKAQHIILNGPVPHIQIRPDGREVKSQRAKRDIPLVGVSLAAMQEFPKGFPRYQDNDNLSALLNQFMRNNGLAETDKHTAYSLRHSFQDRLTASGCNERMDRDLMGHRLGREEYGSGPNLEAKRDLLAAISF